MTYVDMFGTERHSTHCTCAKCTVECEQPWNDTKGKPHVCYRPVGHPGRHRCHCTANRCRDPQTDITPKRSA